MTYTELKKKPNWRVAVIEALAEFNDKPFKYGEADCYILANAAYKAITGKSLYSGVRYTTLAGALKHMKKRKFSNLREAFDKHPHLKRVPHNSLTQRGDFGLWKIDGVWTTLVCDGGRFLGMGEFGLMQVPLNMVKSVYRT